MAKTNTKRTNGGTSNSGRLVVLLLVALVVAVSTDAFTTLNTKDVLHRYNYGNKEESSHSNDGRLSHSKRTATDNSDNDKDDDDDNVVDIAIIGAGIGGLVAGAILNTLYEKKVGIYEAHYLPGGCAHAFEARSGRSKEVFTFDSGPTIVLNCSQKPFNALRQVLETIQQSVEWIPYDGWGMIEYPQQPDKEVRWKFELGATTFQETALFQFGGRDAVTEFETLRTKTKALTVGAEIPALAMRPGPTALIPLLKFFPTLLKLFQAEPDKLSGTFESYMNGPDFIVTNPWLRDWLDALAFSLSGLPAARTSAAAMAFVLDDLHRDGAALDYPQGGMGAIIEALCRGVQHNGTSKIHLRTKVENIDFTRDGSKATGLTLSNGKQITAREGVLCNAPVWSLRSLIRTTDTKALEKLSGLAQGSGSKSYRNNSNEHKPLQTWIRDEDGGGGYSIRMSRLLNKDTIDSSNNSVDHENSLENNHSENILTRCDTMEMTGSFLHLHVAINATGLDLKKMEAHYTVMDRGLSGTAGIFVNGIPDGPCGELNMIAVSNPCVIDPTLAPPGCMVLHAYGAGNEPFEVWEKYRNNRNSHEYKQLKKERSQVLWRALESVIPDIKDRIILDLIGSPLTHERFLRRPRGTYGSATEDYLKDGSTPVSNLVLVGDQIFPGIGIPAVAISGASAANAMVNPIRQWLCLDYLKESGKI